MDNVEDDIFNEKQEFVEERPAFTGVLTNEEKKEVEDQVKKLSKEESEKDIAGLCEHCRGMFEDWDNFTDFSYYEDILTVMLPGEYAISLIDSFNEEIKDKYLSLMTEIRKALEFGNKYHLKKGVSLNISSNKLISEMDELLKNVDNLLKGINSSSETRANSYKNSENESTKLEKEEILSNIDKLCEEYNSVYYNAMKKYCIGLDNTEEIDKMNELSNQIDDYVEKYKAI